MMKKQGFTLAEVLITLVIIGIIAAMTLPSLLGGTNKQELKTGLQKAISVLTQTITLQYALTGNDFSQMDKANVLNYAKARMNVKANDANSVTTADGIVYDFSEFAGDCTVAVPCNIIVDVNGSKGPNTKTVEKTSPTLVDIKDRFTLYVEGTNVRTQTVSCTDTSNLTTCSYVDTITSKFLDDKIGS